MKIIIIGDGRSVTAGRAFILENHDVTIIDKNPEA